MSTMALVMSFQAYSVCSSSAAPLHGQAHFSLTAQGVQDEPLAANEVLPPPLMSVM